VSDTVTVRALATLAPYAPPGGVASVGPGETVAELVDRLGIEPDALGAVLVNENPATPETPLAPGDVVSLVPPITGG
jgi:molybdopterin converting factor small subunit